MEEIEQLDSRWFPTILDAWQADGMTYIVTEPAEGTCLNELKDASEETIERIFLALCDALQELHRHHLVHRNLKLSNILVTDDGIQVVDVSCVKRIEAEADGTVAADTRYLGTIGYAAPEQFGSRPTDVRSDIYTLGVILQVLLTMVSRGEKRRRLQFIMKKCTEYDPAYRFQSLEELETELKTGDIYKKQNQTFNKKWTIFYLYGLYHLGLAGSVFLSVEIMGMVGNYIVVFPFVMMFLVMFVALKLLRVFHEICKRWIWVAYVMNTLCIFSYIVFTMLFTVGNLFGMPHRTELFFTVLTGSLAFGWFATRRQWEL